MKYNDSYLPQSSVFILKRKQEFVKMYKSQEMQAYHAVIPQERKLNNYYTNRKIT